MACGAHGFKDAADTPRAEPAQEDSANLRYTLEKWKAKNRKFLARKE